MSASRTHPQYVQYGSRDYYRLFSAGWRIVENSAMESLPRMQPWLRMEPPQGESNVRSIKA